MFDSLSVYFYYQVEPVIIQAPRDLEIGQEEISSYTGRSLFECQAVGHPSPMIEWYKNGYNI